VVFEYFYDVYLFEIKHICKLNWPKRPIEVLSFSGLTPNEQYEELDISKNFDKPYTNTNFDK
jgi:hypothetical protein